MASSSESTTKPVTPSSSTSGTEPPRNATTGVPHSERLDHHETEWLRPIDRKQQRRCAAEKRRLLGLADLADVLDQRVLQQMTNVAFEVFAIGGIHFGRDLERLFAGDGDRNGAIDTLLPRDSAEEGEIASGRWAEGQQISAGVRDRSSRPTRPQAVVRAAHLKSRRPGYLRIRGRAVRARGCRAAHAMSSRERFGRRRAIGK